MKKILIGVGIVLGVIFLLRFIVGGPEDSWICVNNHWLQHGHPSTPKPTGLCGNKNKIILPNTKEECLKIGGVWEKQGPEPFETCDKKTTDADQTCTDSSQCEGNCLTTLTHDEMRQGMMGKLNINKTGQCSSWIVILGCQARVNNGKVQVICMD